MALFACSFTFVSCGSDDAEEETPSQPEKPQAGKITVEVLTSSQWETNDFGENRSISFTNDKITIMEGDEIMEEYTYTLADGIITIDQGQWKWVSVPCPLYGNNVLVFKNIMASGDSQEEHLGYILVKKGAQINVTAEDIKGFWCWYDNFGGEEGEIIRTAIELDGKNFVLTITPWGQRYIGTYTYENGILTLNATEGLTSREEHTGYGSLWGRMDPKTLECDDWRPLDKENWTVDAVSGSVFVVNSTNAFGVVANIPCIFQPKK